MNTFQPVSRTRVADQIAVAIRGAVLAGKYTPGERLPSERDLASQFDVNRSSVREAIHSLEAWGLVEVRHGGGVTVRDFLAGAGLHLLPWLLAPNGRVDPAMMHDLLTLRTELLGFTGAQAASRATAQDIAALQRALDALDLARGVDAIQEADYAFFETLIVASGNQVLRLMLSAIGAAYQQNRVQFAALYPQDRMVTLAHHAAVAAIQRSDSEAAGEAMRLYGAAALVAWSDQAERRVMDTSSDETERVGHGR
ncbi:MAG: FadR/GntR family transcriptional regulator [Candidatus Nanopelagicales bacterium]|nr:FadR/GntR family transcriptional regulator [Candidatus Nanopelagicales bacterium]MDZ4249741.1 FadR/GntR family transcriptional regulator [Candidatus Nanopelagicales bacterium]MDZ7577679.1 FadR/GntR family transcriptional regulator [Candidatus Nanopelagicales bacterium]